MDLKEIFDEESPMDESSADYTVDLGLKKFKPSRKIKFMRGYTDDGELIFDPFDPKQRNETPDKTVNYNKKFSREMKQHQKLIRQQAQYVDQLEKLFRATTGLGTTNPRQLTKTDVELASVLSQARGQLLQMISGVSSLKKTIADLQLKQYARLASDTLAATKQDAEVPEMRGSAVLQQILSNNLNQLPENNPSLDDLPGIDDDDSLVGKNVRYENQNIQLAVIYHMDDSTHEPVAINEAGEIIDDYELPSYMNDVDLYMTEGVAKDQMGHTFPLIIR